MSKIIAPGVVRLGPLLDQYTESQIRKISCFSVLIYIFSAITFAGTIYLYNPDNLFGDTLISSPINTVIQSNYEPGCTGLSAYAGSSTDFNQEASSVPPIVLLAADGAVSVSFVENTSFIETESDIISRLSFDDGTPIVQETVLTGTNIRYNTTFGFSSSDTIGVQKLNVSIQIAPNAPVFLSGDPDECADFFAETVLEEFDPACFDNLNYPNDFNVEATSCAIAQTNLSTTYRVIANIPITPRYIVDIQILDPVAVRTAMQQAYCGDTGGFNLLRVAPFSCQVATFRDWLEVLALSFSNAGLVYALSATLVFVLVHIGGSSSSEEKHILRSQV